MIWSYVQLWPASAEIFTGILRFTIIVSTRITVNVILIKYYIKEEALFTIEIPLLWIPFKTDSKLNILNGDHSFRTYVKFSEKLTLLTCAYQGVRNVSFSENFAYVLNQ